VAKTWVQYFCLELLSEVLGFLWTVQPLILQGKERTVQWPNPRQSERLVRGARTPRSSSRKPYRCCWTDTRRRRWLSGSGSRAQTFTPEVGQPNDPLIQTLRKYLTAVAQQSQEAGRVAFPLVAAAQDLQADTDKTGKLMMGHRQQTPKNAVAIAKVLLEAGADVDALARARTRPSLRSSSRLSYNNTLV
jgi:hypothetical protein